MLAGEAAEQLGLDRVLLVTTGEAPHKRIEPEPGARVRLELARRAAAGDELLEPSALEVERDGPSYSFRTLEELSERQPEDELFLLMGADAAVGLGSWKRPERVLELARIAVAARPGASADDAQAAVAEVAAGAEVDRVAMPQLDVSSTGIRERVAAGRPIRYLVPDAVGELIAERGLYRQAVRA